MSANLWFLSSYTLGGSSARWGPSGIFAGLLYIYKLVIAKMNTILKMFSKTKPTSLLSMMEIIFCCFSDHRYHIRNHLNQGTFPGLFAIVVDEKS